MLRHIPYRKGEEERDGGMDAGRLCFPFKSRIMLEMAQISPELLFPQPFKVVRMILLLYWNLVWNPVNVTCAVVLLVQFC
ncbi:hypothetical protein V6N12_064326 [Hibiscus sabdariffa]|uniref:Uncharacterized protein n=1 Tax=Hibiscus sabdariffa TaxID=183260 RepID=A0ABR2G5G5_9ROSI